MLTDKANINFNDCQVVVAVVTTVEHRLRGCHVINLDIDLTDVFYYQLTPCHFLELGVSNAIVTALLACVID